MSGEGVNVEAGQSRRSRDRKPDGGEDHHEPVAKRGVDDPIQHSTRLRYLGALVSIRTDGRPDRAVECLQSAHPAPRLLRSNSDRNTPLLVTAIRSPGKTPAMTSVMGRPAGVVSLAPGRTLRT